MVSQVGQKNVQGGVFAPEEGLDRCVVIFAPTPGMDEVQDHLGRAGYQFLEPLVEPGKGSYPHYPAVGLIERRRHEKTKVGS